ncbi:MAG: hypothetical protein KJ000_28985 [Pirellulaceae bacterium]|nr:hypothetical protein [Pirellulaceae bacterium]
MTIGKRFSSEPAITNQAFALLLAAVAWCVLWLFVLPLPPSAARDGEMPSLERKFVVVAPAGFHESLADFLAHKAKQLTVELVGLEDVLKDQSGVDDPEKLKRFLFGRWRDNRLGYALLVGDVDVMPVRYMALDRVTPAAFDYAFYPSDLYYADLAKADGTFDDWNASRDGFHGSYFGEVRGEKNKDGPINEDQVDYLPDIAVGRWPVSTAEQAATAARKTIRYEQGLLAGDKPGWNRTAILAVQGWVDSRRLLDGVARDLSPRWQVTKLYYGSRYPEPTTPPTEAALYDLLNTGVGLVLHTGHGETNRWDHCCTVSGLAQVKNADRLPVLFSVGCSTAHFAPLAPYDSYTDTDGMSHQGTDRGEVFSAPPPPPAAYQREFNRTGLGEAALRHGDNGAVAYIGCNTGSQPCAQTLLVGFSKALANADQPRLGDAWASAVRYYHTQERLADLRPTTSWYPASIFFQGMKFMVFGDPTLLMPPVAPPDAQ